MNESYNMLEMDFEINNPITVYASISIFVLALIIMISDDFYLGPHSNHFQLVNAQPDSKINVSELIHLGSPFSGNLSASLVLIDFSDFQCYLCKRYVDNTEDQIKTSYVEPGKMLYIFKHLPNRGIESKSISLAAQCTNEQGKFWDYHKILYSNQGAIDSGWASIDNLKKYASQLTDFNLTSFELCLDTKKYEPLIDRDIALAHSFGFTKTPSFLIMNVKDSTLEKIEGPKPFPIFEAIVKAIEN
jgi:protein-disulfide isomerase